MQSHHLVMEVSMSDEKNFCSHDYKTFGPGSKLTQSTLVRFMISNSGLKDFIDHVQSHGTLRVRGIIVHDDGTVELATEVSQMTSKIIPRVYKVIAPCLNN